MASDIEAAKMNLAKSHNCQLSSFFEELTNNTSIVPSELQHYLQSLGIAVQLSDLFVLFKRHGDAITGKITAKHFAQIFNNEKEMDSDEYEPLSSESRKEVVSCLLKIIKHEAKI